MSRTHQVIRWLLIPGVIICSAGLPVSFAQEQDSAARAAFLADVDRTAVHLNETSQDVFERGLMTVSRYAVHLNHSLALRRLQDDKAVYVAALQDRANRLERAVRLLGDFNQPASAGWEADTAMAQLLHKDALAAVQAEQASPLLPVQQQELDTLSQRYLLLRERDFRVGLASLPQLTEALTFSRMGQRKLLSQKGRKPSSSDLQQYRALVSEIESATKDYAARDAGIGRRDQVLEAELLATQITAQIAEMQRDENAEQNAWQQADALSQQLLESRLQFYGKGTADLFDVAQAVSARRAIVSQMESRKFKVPDEMKRGLERDLQTVRGLSDELTDRRGQNAANVALVQGLELLVQPQPSAQTQP